MRDFFVYIWFMGKRYTLLLSSILAMFVGLYILLCYYSRLASDDYYFISDVRVNGILKSVYSQYMEWTGRYASTFIMDIFYKIFDVDQTYYFLLPFLSFILLFLGAYCLFKAFAYRLDFNLKSNHLIIGALSFSFLLFFLSYDVGETWFWYCSTSHYLRSIIAFIWGTTFLIGKYNKVVSILFSSILFIFIGGASEAFAAMYGIIILIFILFRYKRSGSIKVFISDSLNFRFSIVSIVFGISFIIFLLAPGNYARDTLFPERHFLNTLFICLKALIKFGVLFMPFRLVYILSFGIPFIAIGSSYSNPSFKNKISFQKIFKTASLLLLSLILLFFLIISFVMIETGPPRIWFFISFLIAFYIVIICFYAGYTGYIELMKINILKTSSLILGVLIMIYCYSYQLPTAIAYSRAHDERISYLKSLNQQIQHDTLIFLKPLPSSGMLYSSEIKADTIHFTNKEIRLGYNLKFHIVSESINH
jgi:hypothetical protein